MEFADSSIENFKQSLQSHDKHCVGLVAETMLIRQGTMRLNEAKFRSLHIDGYAPFERWWRAGRVGNAGLRFVWTWKQDRLLTKGLAFECRTPFKLAVQTIKFRRTDKSTNLLSNARHDRRKHHDCQTQGL